MAKSFHQLNERTQVLVFALLSVITVFAAWQVLIGPERAEVADRGTRLVELEGDVARAKATATKLPAVQREVAALEKSLLETTSVLPDEKDFQDVLRSLQQLATESSLVLTKFVPKPTVAKTQYAEWPIELTLEGTYHDLGRFFDRVAAMPRLMSVSDLDIKARTSPTARGTLAATCLATTFVFKKELVPATAPGGKS